MQRTRFDADWNARLRSDAGLGGSACGAPEENMVADLSIEARIRRQPAGAAIRPA